MIIHVEDDGTLGGYIRKVRSENFYSRRRYSKIVGISDNYLGQIERGEIKEPSPHVLRKIAIPVNMDYLEIMVRAGYLKPGDLRDG